MDPHLAPLERIFQRVEEESERRAQEDGVGKHRDLGDGGESETRPKQKRRGSISITRFGQLAEPSPENGPSTPKLSTIASKSTFYQTKIGNSSLNSFASHDSAELDEVAHTEDDHHVTQMHKIAGRQTISKTVVDLMPRLSRARSANVLAVNDGGVVIGVSVEEATVESHESSDAGRATAYARGGLRSYSSTVSMGGPRPGSSWVTKAKGFTQKFRRKANQPHSDSRG